MLIMKHTKETSATPSQVWQVLQDVENWKSWDHELEESTIEGPFQAGSTGRVKLKNGPHLKTILTYVEPLKVFVQEAKLFLAKAVMTHIIAQVDGKTYVTFQTEIQGSLALFYTWLLGYSIRQKIPVEMKEMLKKAESF